LIRVISMIEKIVRRGVKFVYQYADLDQADREIYSYGIELLVMYAINASILLLLGLIFQRFAETALLLTGFGLLQSFAGGYHSETHTGCLLWMIFGWAASMALLYVAQSLSILAFILSPVGYCLVWVFAPVQNKNYPVGADKEKVMKKKTRIVASLLLLFSLLFLILWPERPWGGVLSVTLFFSGLSIAAAHSKNKKRKDDSIDTGFGRRR